METTIAVTKHGEEMSRERESTGCSVIDFTAEGCGTCGGQCYNANEAGVCWFLVVFVLCSVQTARRNTKVSDANTVEVAK